MDNCTERIEFESKQEMCRLLKGLGNIDNYLATSYGVPFTGMSVRLCNATIKLWSIYWPDSNEEISQPPVIGSFDYNIAIFFAEDIFNNRKIFVVFRWNVADKNTPVWRQAFCDDNGKSWE